MQSGQHPSNLLRYLVQPGSLYKVSWSSFLKPFKCQHFLKLSSAIIAKDVGNKFGRFFNPNTLGFPF